MCDMMERWFQIPEDVQTQALSFLPFRDRYAYHQTSKKRFFWDLDKRIEKYVEEQFFLIKPLLKSTPSVLTTDTVIPCIESMARISRFFIFMDSIHSHYLITIDFPIKWVGVLEFLAHWRVEIHAPHVQLVDWVGESSDENLRLLMDHVATANNGCMLMHVLHENYYSKLKKEDFLWPVWRSNNQQMWPDTLHKKFFTGFTESVD